MTKIPVDIHNLPKIPTDIAVCPVCGAGLVLKNTGDLDFCVKCSKEPYAAKENEYAWWKWFRVHNSSSVIDWLPLEQRIFDWFDANYKLTK